MPLQFIIDRDLPADISTITLSYTLFDVTDMAQRRRRRPLKPTGQGDRWFNQREEI
jgi:cytochrome c oxidase assembly protein Cox11